MASKTQPLSTLFGKVQFFDIAPLDLVPGTSWKRLGEHTLRPQVLLNKSLMSFVKCISSLDAGEVAPFQSSALSHLATDALAGNSKTYVLATVKQDAGRIFS